MAGAPVLGPWAPFLFAIFGRVAIGLWLFCSLEGLTLGLAPSPLRSFAFYSVVVFVCSIMAKNAIAFCTMGPVPDLVVTPETGHFLAETVSWAVCSMRGWRDAMEDSHVAEMLDPSIFPDTALFAVLDGHGGSEVSALASCLLTGEVNACGRELRDGGEASPLGAALETALPRLDARIRAGSLGLGRLLPMPPYFHPFACVGSTACVAAVDFTSREVLVANVGDSRALLIRNGKAVALSQDHKPEDQKERARIRAAGGQVQKIGPCHRVDGTLNLSRALGDFLLKANGALPPDQQKVIAYPDSTRTPFAGGEKELLVVACDGLFERCSNQDVANIIWPRLKQGMALEQIGKELLHACCATSRQGMPMGDGTDNETVILIKLPEATKADSEPSSPSH